MTELIPSTDIERIVAIRNAIVEKAASLRAAWDELQDLALTVQGRKKGDTALYGVTLPCLWLKGHNIDEEFSVTGVAEMADQTFWCFLMEQSGMLTYMHAAARADWDDQVRRRPSKQPKHYVDPDADPDCPKPVIKPALPELTLANIASTFDDLLDRRHDFLVDGVVNVFQKLSWDYRTNKPVGFGKRLILSHLLDSHGFFCHPTCNSLDDLLRVCFKVDNKPEPDHRQGMWQSLTGKMDRVRQYDRSTGQWVHSGAHEFENDYIHVRWFKKGTGHLTFKRPDIVAGLNRLLAKRYPDAIPGEKNPKGKTHGQAQGKEDRAEVRLVGDRDGTVERERAPRSA